jgi:hypothetical protein
MPESLFQLGPLNDFIQLIIWTGQVEGERPVSAIVIAPAGTGKTTLLEGLKCPQAEFVGDLTSRPLSGLVKDAKEMTHILLGDMLSMFGHKSSTVKLTMRLVSQMTGEALLHDPWTGQPLPEPRKLGLITAIPPKDYEREKQKIADGGFGSRFILIRYTYKPSTIASIHRWIQDNKYSKPGKPFSLPNPGRWDIKIPKPVDESIKEFALSLKRDKVGFRIHRHLRSLVKAAARRRQSNSASIKDLNLVKSYCDFFSSQGKEI